jgi:O-antigen ligase
MPDLATNSNIRLKPPVRTGKVSLRYAVWFLLLVLAGGVTALFPAFWLGCLAIAAVIGICWVVFAIAGRAGLEPWQVIALTILGGYIVLNYGFDNLAIHLGGFPILIAYGLIYVSLALAVLAHRHLVPEALREPALLCVLAILCLSLFHLPTDIPAYGSWAFRDCTMCFDGLFVLMGMLWAKKSDSSHFLMKWLMAVFIVNMFYSITLPWSEQIWSWSPQSGVYNAVPLLGNYHGSGDVLFAGAVFCICVGSYVISRPRWLMPLLVLGQLLGIAVTQVRRMYLGIVVVILILILAGEIKKFARLFILVPAALAVVFAVTSWGGLEISGRVGKVSLQFFADHLRSLSGAEDAPGSDPQTRVSMGREALQHFYAHPVIGEGFGQPVTDEMDYDTGLITRTPHNTSITYLARLGVVGFSLWMAFHFCLWKRFYYAYRQRRSADKQLYTFVLWFFLYYVLFMMTSLVESPFEYPASAIPFYFLIGFALGLIRWHLSPKNKREVQSAAFAE